MIWPEIPPGIAPWAYYACVGTAVLVIGLSKAGFGGGIGILAVPLAGAVLPADRMLGTLLPLLIAADCLSNLHYLRQREWRLLKPLLAGAAVGIAAGTAFIWHFSRQPGFERGLSLLIGSVCILCVGVQLPGLWGRRVPSLPPGRNSSFAVGGVAGFVSTLSHGAGPIATLYLLQEKLEKRRLVGTLVFFFLVVNVAKVPTYLAQELINERTLRDTLWVLPLLPLGTLSGAWLNRRVPERPFILVMYAATALTAAHMIWRALSSG